MTGERGNSGRTGKDIKFGLECAILGAYGTCERYPRSSWKIRPEDKDLRVFGHEHGKKESVHEKSSVIRTRSWHANVYGTCRGKFSHRSRKYTIRGK